MEPVKDKAVEFDERRHDDVAVQFMLSGKDEEEEVVDSLVVEEDDEVGDSLVVEEDDEPMPKTPKSSEKTKTMVELEEDEKNHALIDVFNKIKELAAAEE